MNYPFLQEAEFCTKFLNAIIESALWYTVSNKRLKYILATIVAASQFCITDMSHPTSFLEVNLKLSSREKIILYAPGMIGFSEIL